jgi:hypothetical protein
VKLELDFSNPSTIWLGTNFSFDVVCSKHGLFQFNLISSCHDYLIIQVLMGKMNLHLSWCKTES